MTAIIRLATASDADSIRAIYAPIVQDTIISFETESPTVDEMRERIVSTTGRFPWLVCQHDGDLLGYAYASAHRTRAAYQWSADVSVYVSETRRRNGVGRALYTALLAILPLQNYYNAYAGIALPNAASVGAHEAMGFKPIGVYQKVGYKFGAWHDVGWWELRLRPHDTQPQAPLPLAEVFDSDGWHKAIAAGVSRLQI
jgi:phosphinothricin acetyltransferase